jgi:hypothetical protein
MTESASQENPHPDIRAGVKHAMDELTQARALEAHIRPQDSSDVSLHLQELLDHLVSAGFALAAAVGALESKVYESEK